MGGRLAGADFMRALACLLVLIHHLVLRLDFNAVSDGIRPMFELARFGNYGVSIFFVLSGFLLARPFWIALDNKQSPPSLKAYGLRRAARVLPGFWMALTVGFVLSFTVYDFPLNSERVGRYLAGFFLMSQWHWRTFFPVEGDGPLWSIPFEATCYVLLPLCFVLLSKFPGVLGRGGRRIVFLMVAVTALLGHWLIVSQIQMDEVARGWNFGMQGGAKEWMPRFNPIGFFVIFAIGALAAGIHTMLPERRSTIFDVIALMALTSGAVQLFRSVGGTWEGYGWLGIPYGFPLLPLAVGTALCALPRSALLGDALDNRAVRLIATVSFGIYIWQDIVLSMMVKVVPGSFGVGSGDALSGWIASSLIATILTLLAATASYTFLERPVVRRAGGLDKSRWVPAAY